MFQPDHQFAQPADGWIGMVTRMPGEAEAEALVVIGQLEHVEGAGEARHQRRGQGAHVVGVAQDLGYKHEFFD